MTTLKHKPLLYLLFTLLLSSCIYFGGSDDDDPLIDVTSNRYDPVILKRESFNTSIELMPPQNQGIMGKIYIKDNYLFINEPNKGFHIYDNSNPENPIKLKFLKVLGSTDVSIKQDILYVNNAVDIIALSFSNDFNEVTVSKRIENVFPEMISPDGYRANIASDEVVIDWTLKN
ncbi:hypothetical protein EYD45_07220 [Hyunsoonleella flava]|uniref:LVIVD repeat-containing protein n=1 Tax=Hyunsoonleella flava TaxID=2527939 RepID=A0A4Q9FFI1_9FLAO|nr:hypothetical protein [Hyunsoonleella flava]TBN04401.1 hypothetical protein EYD45_07220 [Hyunsoonleella flava]